MLKGQNPLSVTKSICRQSVNGLDQLKYRLGLVNIGFEGLIDAIALLFPPLPSLLLLMACNEKRINALP